MIDLNEEKLIIDKIIQESKLEMIAILQSKEVKNWEYFLIHSLQIDLFNNFKYRASNWVTENYAIPQDVSSVGTIFHIPEKEYLYLTLMSYAMKKEREIEEAYFQELKNILSS